MYILPWFNIEHHSFLKWLVCISCEALFLTEYYAVITIQFQFNRTFKCSDNRYMKSFYHIKFLCAFFASFAKWILQEFLCR